MKTLPVYILSFFCLTQINAQEFTREDTIRGSVGEARVWWDLVHYDLQLSVHPDEKFIKGSNTVTYEVISDHEELQIDLQEPLQITSVSQDGKELRWRSEGNAHFIKLEKEQEEGTIQSVIVHYEGIPHVAVRPPWDGGITWQEDQNGNPFVASSCQGIGASIWWPCKDHMSDEVDSMDITVAVPNGLMDVSNGKLIAKTVLENDMTSFHWAVKNPINNYGVNLSVGDYVSWEEEYVGENGKLPLYYYVLRDNEKKARDQFKQVHLMLDAFEHWFGPYPFYEDGFKLVEVPYLGMEHQSAVTYGNGYGNGYRGMDLSDSGWGLEFDFIIIHEAGHEWFANNITYKDRADMWIHESFTAYSESLYVEYHFGKEAGQDYVIGTRKNIQNDKPIIAPYGVNAVGSGDMYYKGSNMLHTLRQWINDDEKWRNILRGLNETFYHQTVTSVQIENYIEEHSGIELTPFFDQYLRTNDRPILEYEWKEGRLRFRWTHIVPGFEMPVLIHVDGRKTLLKPTSVWKSVNWEEKPG